MNKFQKAIQLTKLLFRQEFIFHSIINILYKIRRYFYFFFLLISPFNRTIISWSCRAIFFSFSLLFLSILLHSNSWKHFHFIGLKITYHILKFFFSFKRIYIRSFWSCFCAWTWSLVIWLTTFWSTRSLVMSCITTFRCALLSFIS